MMDIKSFRETWNRSRLSALLLDSLTIARPLATRIGKVPILKLNYNVIHFSTDLSNIERETEKWMKGLFDSCNNYV